MRTRLSVIWWHGWRLSANQGFTLLELTVVLVVIGVLAAIAVPTFISQANKAKQVEAKTYLGSLNRAQQAYYLEHADFANRIPDLNVGLQTQSANYQYSVSVPGHGGNGPYALHYAESRSALLKPYTSIAALVTNNGEALVDTLICEAERPTAGTATPPVRNSASLTCASGTQEIMR